MAIEESRRETGGQEEVSTGRPPRSPCAPGPRAGHQAAAAAGNCLLTEVHGDLETGRHLVSARSTERSRCELRLSLPWETPLLLVSSCH